MRIYDPRLGRFLSVDLLTGDYPSWSPYPFAMNRPIDGVDLDGMEWQPVNGKGENVSADSKDVARYSWAGFNKDGSAVKGTVAGGVVYSPRGYHVLYTSNAATQSGDALFMSGGSTQFRRGDALRASGRMPYDVNIHYQDRFQREGGLVFSEDRKYTDVTATAESENGSKKLSYEKPYNAHEPGAYFNSIRYNLGFVNSLTGEAIESDGLGPADYLIGIGEIKFGKGVRTLLNGGLSFSEYKLARGGGGLVENIELNAYHRYYKWKFPNRVEYDHRFITQAMQRNHNLPNWLVNNRLNVFKTTTIKHAQRDLYRYKFLPREIKLRLGPGGDLR
jgi:hypothetical protein